MADPESDFEYRHPEGYTQWGPNAEQAKAAREHHWEDVAQLQSGSGYEWAQIDVWRRKRDGKLVYDDDAGCSCNGPYDQAEYGQWSDDLREIDNYATFRDWVHEWASVDNPDASWDPSATEVAAFLDTVRRALDVRV